MILSWVLGNRLASARAIGGAAKAVRAPNAKGLILRPVEVLLIISIILFALNLIAWKFGLLDAFHISDSVGPTSAMIFAVISLSLLSVLILVSYGPELIHGTVQAFVTGIKNFVVISMLVACVFASVFFSFDSLFSRILPDDERRRIADFRSRSVVMDIRSALQVAALDEHDMRRKALFQSTAWSKYRSDIEEITTALNEVPQIVDAQIARDKEKKRQSERKQVIQVARFAEKRAQMEQRRVAFQGELKISREKYGIRQATIVALTEKMARLQRHIAVKTVELDAELNGLGSSRVKGRGPAYRQLADEVAASRSRLQRLSAERTVVKAQRDELSTTNLALETEIAERIDAERRLSYNSNGLIVADGQQERIGQLTVQKANSLLQITKLRSAQRQFETEPSSGTLATLQSHCAVSLDALKLDSGRSALKSHPTCEASGLRAKAAPVFASKDGLLKLEADCLNQGAPYGDDFEAGVVMARQCIVTSGLLPARTASLTAKLEALERERDDKAHRFVVSMNAFLDGNKLAFLAAGIALAIDLLVLASGLLGALALQPRVFNVVIPNEDMPNDVDGERHSDFARILRLALGDAAQDNAQRVLEYIEPSERGPSIGMKIEIAGVANEDRGFVRQFLNAGAAFGLVYSTATSEAAIGINNSLYLAVLELADRSDVQIAEADDAALTSSASAGFRRDVDQSGETFTAAVMPALPKHVAVKHGPSTQSPTPLDKPKTDKVVKPTLSPNGLEEIEQPVETQTPAGCTEEVDRLTKSKQAAAPSPTDNTETPLVSVTNDNFNFDQ